MLQKIITEIQNEISRDCLSTADMARRLGLNQPTLHRILNGDRGIGWRTLEQILAARPQWINLINDNGNQPPAGP